MTRESRSADFPPSRFELQARMALHVGKRSAWRILSASIGEIADRGKVAPQIVGKLPARRDPAISMSDFPQRYCWRRHKTRSSFAISIYSR
jgi:hypothetical protein